MIEQDVYAFYLKNLFNCVNLQRECCLVCRVNSKYFCKIVSAFIVNYVFLTDVDINGYL